MSLLNQQMAERRERILDTARGIIGERGYDGLTMRDLAQQSRVTVPTIYNLIGSKEQVLFAAVEEQTERFLEGLEGARGDVLAIVDASVREMLRMPHYYRSLLLLLFSSDTAQPARRDVEQALAERLETALAELAEDGHVAAWVDLAAARDRIHAHLEMTSLQWARGRLSPAVFRATARYEAAVTLAGFMQGEHRAELERAARESQSGVRPRSRRPRTPRAKIEEARG